MHSPHPPAGDHGAELNAAGLDTSSHSEFYEYYAAESVTEETLRRFRHVRDVILTIAGQCGLPSTLSVADVGCGAGASTRLWAEAGHAVWGIDVNQPLIELARERLRQVPGDVHFEVGSATSLPLNDASVDICSAVELLEHVEDWSGAVREFVRVLKPGGLLWMTTTNTLCPKQDEFTLPMFSWYPPSLKQHYIKLAATSRPELANYARYPAYHWFTPYGLKHHLETLGMSSMDRFDIAYRYKTDSRHRMVLRMLRSVPPLRFLGHVLTSGTTVLARKMA